MDGSRLGCTSSGGVVAKLSDIVVLPLRNVTLLLIRRRRTALLRRGRKSLEGFRHDVDAVRHMLNGLAFGEFELSFVVQRVKNFNFTETFALMLREDQIVAPANPQSLLEEMLITHCLAAYSWVAIYNFKPFPPYW